MGLQDTSMTMSMTMSTPETTSSMSSQTTVKDSTTILTASISPFLPTSTTYISPQPLPTTALPTSTTSISTKPPITSTSSSIASTTVSTSIITSTTTTFPLTSSSTSFSLPTSSILTTSVIPTPSHPANITIVQPPPTNHTAAIIGISVGSSIAFLLLLTILGIWYAHIRSRNKARREEEIEIATNSQGTFVGGYKLAQLKAHEEEEATVPEPSKESEVKAAGVRRSNTREDGRRSGVVLRVANPEASALSVPAPVPEKIEVEPDQQSVEGGERARARFEAWKKAQGMPSHNGEAATLYHHAEFLQSAAKPNPQPQSQPQPEPETNTEILAQGVKRMRSTLDSWKSGVVDPGPVSIPEVKVTPATPRLENVEFGKEVKRLGRGQKKETEVVAPVKKGPTTFEAMGLKESKKGLGVDMMPQRSVGY